MATKRISKPVVPGGAVDGAKQPDPGGTGYADGDTGAPIPIIEPVTGAGDSGGDAKRGPGRPPGAKNGSGGNAKSSAGKEKITAANLRPDTLVPYIVGFHMMLAAKNPEMAMGPGEALTLSTAICNYLRHTAVEMSQKNADLSAVIGAILMIEGTRLVAIANRIKKEREVNAAVKRGVSSVVPMSPQFA